MNEEVKTNPCADKADIYRQVIELSFGVPYQRNHQESHYTFIGQGIEELTGIPAEEFTFDKFTEIVVEWHMVEQENADKSPEQIAMEFNAGKIPNYKADLRIINPQGESRWLSDSSVPVYDEETEKIVGSLGILQDITDRKRAESKIIRSEALFRAVFEQSVMGIALCTPEGLVMTTNTAFQKMLGYTAEELQRVRPVKFTFPDDVKLETELVLELLSGKRDTLQIEKRYVRKDGRIIWGHLTMSLIRDAEEAPLFLLGIVLDITERKKAEQALWESNKRYNQLVKRIPVGVFRVCSPSQDSAYLDYVSPRFCKMVNITEERLKSDFRALYEIFPPAEMDEFLQAQRKAKEKQLPLTWEGRTVIRGEPRWTHVESFPTEIQKNCVVWDGILVDLTERKNAENERLEMERQVQQAQRLESLGVLAGGVAHDFNNILMAILGHADLAMLEVAPNSKPHNNVFEIKKASYRAAELCNQMLAYSGRGHFLIQNLNLNDLVLEILQLLKTSIGKRGELELNLAPKLPSIYGDVTQIRQILLNLITNASESINDETGTISIETYSKSCDQDKLSELRTKEKLSPGNYVILKISDTGCGMDEKTLGQIFEPFFTTKFTGRGLGLSAVMGIVQGHKGGVQVESTPANGTSFKIFLPVSTSEVDTGELQNKLVDGDFEGKKFHGCVLLVDDEVSVREVTEKMLRWFGLSVIVAQDGQRAIEIYRNKRKEIDCVFLDLTMPNMNGEEVLRNLRQIDPNSRVIISSGYDKKDILSRFKEDEVAGYIQKPYTLERLKAALAKVLPQRTIGKK